MRAAHADSGLSRLNLAGFCTIVRRAHDAASVRPVADSTGTAGAQHLGEVDRLRGELAAARAEIERLTAQLGEQEGLSRRVEHARAAWAETIDALPQPIFMHDDKGCIVRANKAYAERTGVPVKNLTGRVYWKLFPVRDAAFPVGAQDTGDGEFELALSPEETFLVRSVGASAGLPPGWRLFLFQDITRLKRAEAAAGAAAGYATAIVESALATIVAVDRDRRIVTFNPAAERAFGYTRDEVFGKHVNMLYADPEVADAMRRSALERNGAVVEIVNRRKSGETFTSLLSIAPLRGADGKLLGVVGASVDVTDRKEADAKLQAALADLEQALEHSPAGIALVRDRIFARVSRRFAEILGYEKHELVGRSTALIYAGADDYQRIGREAYPELARGRMYETDLQLQRKDGSLMWAHLCGRGSGAAQEGGKSVWVIDDISQRRTSEESAQRREAYYRGLVEMASDVAIVIGADGAIKYESPGIERILGYRDAERAGHSTLELVHTDDVNEVQEVIRRLLRGDASHAMFEFRARHRDGNWRIIEAAASGVLESAGGRIGIANLRDVTERRRAQQQFQKSMEDAVAAIAAAIEIRDPYAAGHQRRVADLAGAIAREMGLDAERTRGLQLAARVHDIGNVRLPDGILVKPGPLTELEYAFVKTHPQSGHDILKDIDFPWPVAEIVLQHHELLDGSGYPRGLKGEEIMEEARILTVANVVGAMTAPRAHLAAVDVETALAEVTRLRGTKFDAQAADACVRLFRERGYAFE
jgi:PAS domain S-box-containing protein